MLAFLKPLQTTAQVKSQTSLKSAMCKIEKLASLNPTQTLLITRLKAGDSVRRKKTLKPQKLTLNVASRPEVRERNNRLARNFSSPYTSQGCWRAFQSLSNRFSCPEKVSINLRSGSRKLFLLLPIGEN
jgi:hypothetical protein